MEEYKIEIESTGDYAKKKEFNITVNLSDREYLSLVSVVLDFIENKATQGKTTK